MRAAKAAGSWLVLGALAVACSAKPADGGRSSELPLRSAPQQASAPPMAPVSAGSTSPPPRAPRGDLCHIVADSPHRAAFSWNDTAIWSDLQMTPHDRDVYVLDSSGAAYLLRLVDGKIQAERTALFDALDGNSAMGSLKGQERALGSGPMHGPWRKGEVEVDTGGRDDLMIFFPAQPPQRLHEIVGFVSEITFASHASGVAIVGHGGRYSAEGQEENPFILRWSNGHARRRVRENFPGTVGPPHAFIGPDASPWLLVSSIDHDDPRARRSRVLKLAKSRWLTVGEWHHAALGYDMVLPPDGDAWVLLGTSELNVPDEQGGLWRLPAGSKKWERIAPELIGPCRRYSLRALIPIARNHLMMLTKVQVEGTSSCETRGWATVELRLDDAIDPAFAARCATLPGPASRGASP